MSSVVSSKGEDVNLALKILNEPGVQSRALAASRKALIEQLKKDGVNLTPELVSALVDSATSSSKSAEDVLAGAAAVVIGIGLSDAFLKEEITRVGVSESGIGIFEFSYYGSNERRVGAIAQDVLVFRPEAVVCHESGFLAVDYAKIDVATHLVASR
jgi:hypothetical protein